MGRVLFDAGTINPHSIATSELSPQDPEVSAYIRLRREFFDLPPNRQVLTLLHETIHLALFAGPCADWNTENCEINGRYTENPLEASQTRQLVDGAALRTAIQLFHFKDEIAAEKYLQRHHAAQGHERAAYYLDMQLSNREKRANRNLPPELLPFWLLLDVLRAGLGCAISNKELHKSSGAPRRGM
jgi:hypothetical protein